MPSKFPGKKLKKGDHTFETANGVMALIWKDKKVKMLSTMHTSEMVDTEKTEKHGDTIIKPAGVVSYYQGMGGVDCSDQLSAICCSVRKHVK